MVKPDSAFIGTEMECDDCGEKFILAARNQIHDGNAWVLVFCDTCIDVKGQPEGHAVDTDGPF